MVRIDDNQVINESSITATMKPGAIFDIGITVEQLIDPLSDEYIGTEFEGGCSQCGRRHKTTYETKL